MDPVTPRYLTVALYQFVDLPDCATLRAPLQALCDEQGVRGMLLLAPEGINGTIAGKPDAVHAVLTWLRSDARFAALQHKEAPTERQPFYRMRVRLKREIVTLGVPGLNPARNAGTYVKPEDWNALIDDPDVVVVDTRNDYEVGIGTFERAVNPHTKSFAEFPAWVAAQSQPGGVLAGKPRVAMFCTGGIRCEKSTAFLKSQGFEEVFHLEGGILKYLETMPEQDSRWQGDCFVFDERVSVGHGLAPGHHQLCRSCRMPLGEAELASPHYVRGVSCPYCHGTRTPEQERALAQTQLRGTLQQRYYDASQRLDWLARQLRHPQQKLDEQKTHLAALQQNLRFAMQNQHRFSAQALAQQQQKLAHLRPDTAAVGRDLAAFQTALQQNWQALFNLRRQGLEKQAALLEAVSPQHILARGFSVVKNSRGQVIRNADSLKQGQKLHIVFAEGETDVRVTREHKQPDLFDYS